MNKTININLGGIFFHIDEEAYQKMKRYLDAIRRSLSDDPQGRDEIIADIELRIGELLSERVKDVRQVVNESDIDEIIAVMGQPEDYMIDEELFTDDSGKNYSSKSSKKKLFRDGDDKFFGGVASGIAHYFNVDVIWIRIAFLVTVFAGFGSGLIAYIVLWILLPEATTTAEKLQMEGEPVNISNIEKKIKEEFGGVSEMVRNAAHDVTDAVKDVSQSFKKKGLSKAQIRSRNGIQDFTNTLVKIISSLFMVLGKFIGVIVIIISVIALVALVISLFTASTVDFMGATSLFGGEFLVNDTEFSVWLISLIIIILVGIPLVMFFVLGLFILSNKTKILSKTTKLIFLSLWIIALFGAIYLGVSQGIKYANEGTSIEKNDIYSLPSDTLTIKMIDDELLSGSTNFTQRFSTKKVLDTNDQIKYYSNNVHVDVKLSDSAEAYIKLYKKANGKTHLLARENAKKLEYNYNVSGTNLALNSYFITDYKNSFRNKNIRVTLYVPKNQVLYFDESTRVFLRQVKTVGNIYNRDMPEHYFKMTDAGLECLDCPVLKAEISEETKEEKKIEKDGVDVSITKDSLKIEFKDDGEKAEIKLDKNGVKIR
ncbi:MAG TPA: transcriptional regulator [Flavobacteriaceae bacterium]|nr:transcriptional regulator [Flavobacteriaceae bacterium]